ncbi:TonB-dependent receptor domain-containing protein [Sphingosinicella terrae]|uniref:TonB-dependent receptor domain-containing protein n=1 Tax=Sphingosinicella terrae TaxID=2172047 RepID=UPI0013B3B259|nr:TonB-dependent receptor [Sphingosinicella terrae]
MTAATFVGGVAVATPAAAQTTEDPQDETTNLPEADVGPAPAPAQAEAPTAQADIVVTGSRAAVNGFSAPSPTLVVGSELVDQQSAATIAQVLYQVPAFRATRSPSANAINFSSPGQAMADLRGLGPQRTLVLVNGSRVVPSAASVNASAPVTTDLNVIPTLMVNRVEIVTGGASAQYGSDAVSGVVNILLHRRMEGLRLTAQAGIAEAGDNFNYRLGAIGGFDFADGRGHFVASVEYNDSKGVDDIYARDWGREEWMIVSNSAFATNGLPANIVAPNVHNNVGAGGVILGPVGFALRGFTFNDDGSVRRFDSGSLNNGTYQIGGEGRTSTVGISLVPPVRRFTSYARLEYEFSEALTASVEGGYAETRGILSGGIARFNSQVISRDNAYLPAAVRAAMDAQGLTSFTLAKTFYDMGNARFEASNDTPHLMVAVEGDLGGSWHYDAHYSWGENRFRNDITNNLLGANIAFAVDAVVDPATGRIVCRAALAGNPAAAGCVPINPFGPNATTPEAQAYVNGSGWSTSLYTQDAAAVNVRGEPFSTWAGPVSIAFGGEHRRETQRVEADPVSGNRGFALVGNVGTFRGAFDVTEGYVEAIVPLARDLPFARALDLNGAIRYADYSTVGGQTNWKVGAVYEPVDGLRLRVTRSRDIRAPAIYELFGPGSVLVNLITVNGISARVPQNVTVGNPDLDPEKGDTFTAGMVIEPRGIPNLRASIDYYEIDLDSAITSISAGTIGSLCTLGQTQFCDYITFNGAGVPVSVTAPQQNIGSLRTNGIDAVLNYRLPLGGGASLSAALSGTYVFHSYVNSGAPGSVDIDRSGENGQANAGAVPRFRGNASLTYADTLFSLTGQVVFVSSGTIDNSYNTAPALTITDNDVPAIAYVNLYSTINITPDAELSFTVNNLFDTDPPVVPYPVFITPTNGVYYDKIGRAFQVGVNLRF